MGQLRTVLVGFYTFYLAAASIYALTAWQRGIPALSCVGLLLAAGSPLAGIGWQRRCQAHLNREQALGFSMVSGIGLAMTMAISWRFGEVAGNNHVWAGLALVGWVAYLRWLRGSNQPTST